MDSRPLTHAAILRGIGVVTVTPLAALLLETIGVAPECVGIEHQHGRWGGIAGVRRSLWAHNASMDALGIGGWISLHEVGRDVLLWVVTSIAVSAVQRRTNIYLLGESPPVFGGIGE